MVYPGKKILYWGAVALYGVVLLGILLYLRFPETAFRQYCELRVEKIFPQVDCTIARVSFGFPAQLVFEEIRFELENAEKTLLLEDPQLVVSPIWKHFGNRISLRSRAYGGSHTAEIDIDAENNRVEIAHFVVENIDLEQVPFFEGKLDRTLRGILSGSGSAVLRQEGFAVITAQGNGSITNGEIGLKNPILGLNSLDMDSGSADFAVKAQKISLRKGEVEGPKIKADFQGDITLAGTLSASDIAVEGSLIPLQSLTQENRRVRQFITGLQKKNRSNALPFRIGGTLGNPAFVFAQ